MNIHEKASNSQPNDVALDCCELPLASDSGISAILRVVATGHRVVYRVDDGFGEGWRAIPSVSSIGAVNALARLEIEKRKRNDNHDNRVLIKTLDRHIVIRTGNATIFMNSNE